MYIRVCALVKCVECLVYYMQRYAVFYSVMRALAY